MSKSIVYQILIMVLVMIISSVLGIYYYQTYIAPESYTIGTGTVEVDYKTLSIADYISDEDVIFSQNENDASFTNSNGTATYEYTFAQYDFNGIDNSYIIYVNDYMINNISQNAGTISGEYTLNYYDTQLNTLCSSTVTISFSFTSLVSRLKITLPSDELGYLLNYFKTDNFIVTLALNPYTFGETITSDTPEVYTITLYDYWNSTEVSTIYSFADRAITLPTLDDYVDSNTTTTYTFDGWSDDGTTIYTSTYTVNSSVVLYAVYSGSVAPYIACTITTASLNYSTLLGGGYSLDIEYNGETISITADSTFTIYVMPTESITIYPSTARCTANITTDGYYSANTVGSTDTPITINWYNCSYLTITLTQTNMVTV